jgi:hypothetical protein
LALGVCGDTDEEHRQQGATENHETAFRLGWLYDAQDAAGGQVATSRVFVVIVCRSGAAAFQDAGWLTLVKLKTTE